MNLAVWIICGFIIGLMGYAIDPHRSIEGLIGSLLLGMVGAFQGLMVSNILSTIPLIGITPSPLLFSFAGGLLLLSLGKLTRRAFS